MLNRVISCCISLTNYAVAAILLHIEVMRNCKPSTKNITSRTVRTHKVITW